MPHGTARALHVQCGIPATARAKTTSHFTGSLCLKYGRFLNGPSRQYVNGENGKNQPFTVAGLRTLQPAPRHFSVLPKCQHLAHLRDISPFSLCFFSVLSRGTCSPDKCNLLSVMTSFEPVHDLLTYPNSQRTGQRLREGLSLRDRLPRLLAGGSPLSTDHTHCSTLHTISFKGDSGGIYSKYREHHRHLANLCPPSCI